MDSSLTHEDLAALARAPYLLDGKPVTPPPVQEAPPSDGRPVELKATEPFTVNLTVPPLYRPEVEILGEGLVVRGATGEVVETYWRVSPTSREFRCGPVAVQVEQAIAAVDVSREAATKKLTDLIGQLVAQAWVRMVTGDEREQQAARSMQVGFDEYGNRRARGGA